MLAPATESVDDARVGVQRFARCDIVGLPHPTGGKGLSNRYVAEFRLEISSILGTGRTGMLR